MNNWGNILQNQDRTSIVLGLVLYIIAILLGIYYGELLFTLAVIGLHMYLSIITVEPNEWGALLFLRSAFRQLDNTPVYACWPFFAVKREVRTVFQVIVGTPITDKEGKAVEPKTDGFTVLREEEPFRVTFPAIEDIPTGGRPDKMPPEFALPEVTPKMVKKFKGSPLHRTLTCDPQMVFWFDIRDYLDYLKVVPDVNTLSHNITGIAKATLQECAGRVTLGMLIAYNEIICARITYRIEQLIGESHAQVNLNRPNIYWGVNFRGVQISSMGLPKTINESMRTASAAEYGKNAIITTAQATKQETIEKGIGNADALRRMGEAEASRALALAGVVDAQGGMVVLQLEALKTAIKEGNVTILPLELASIAGLLSGGRALLGGATTTPPPPPKPRP